MHRNTGIPLGGICLDGFKFIIDFDKITKHLLVKMKSEKIQFMIIKVSFEQKKQKNIYRQNP